jgi:hypothetical protein
MGVCKGSRRIGMPMLVSGGKTRDVGRRSFIDHVRFWKKADSSSGRSRFKLQGIVACVSGLVFRRRVARVRKYLCDTLRPERVHFRCRCTPHSTSLVNET